MLVETKLKLKLLAIAYNCARMDLSTLLNSVKNVNDYITITQDLTGKYKSQNIEFNMSVVISLKNVRSLEIEVSFCMASFPPYIYLQFLSREILCYANYKYNERTCNILRDLSFIQSFPCHWSLAFIVLYRGLIAGIYQCTFHKLT